MKAEDLKVIVKDKYSEIAKQSGSQSCCGSRSGCCSTVDYSVFADSYLKINGYNPDADLGLGCGIPTEFARIKEGDTVIDLGSGAGNDCFVARALVGETGKVIGVDMTEAMIEKARANAAKLNYTNVTFVLGDIENIPVSSSVADVIVSNCVLNLVPDKDKAFSEIFRVLKPGGCLSVSDIVLNGNLPEKFKEAAELYAGCISGAIQKNDYLKVIQRKGFVDLKVQKEKVISLTDRILNQYLSAAEVSEYKKTGFGIFSITVYAEKPVSI